MKKKKPTNAEKIENIRRWQTTPFFHPLTCRVKSSYDLLEPMEWDGHVILECPTCGYVQKEEYVPETAMERFEVAEPWKSAMERWERGEFP